MAVRNAIWVPMKLDAYFNYDPRKTSNIDPRERAYLAPLTSPNLQGLQIANGLVQHDIFDQHRNAPYMGCSDRYRTTSTRQGLYLHWSLPRMYRVGVAGSSSTDSQQSFYHQLIYGGYSGHQNSTAATGTDIGTPRFRTVPTRWVIMRTVRPASSGPYSGRLMVRKALNENQDSEVDLPRAYYTPYGQDPGRDPNVVRKFFVVESDAVRDITTIPANEDIELTTSSYIDSIENTSLSRQGQIFLGKTSLLDNWTGDGNNPPANPVPITVSRAANPYFADYQPQNGSVFSFFDDLTVPDIGVGLGASKYTQASISYTVVGYHTTDLSDPLFLDVNYVKDQKFADRLARCSLNLSNVLDASDTAFIQSLPPQQSTAANMRTLCFGTLYALPWSHSPTESPLPSNFTYPGDAIQKLFADTHPLAVGTNPIDALFAWLRSTNDTGSVTTAKIRQDLWKIHTLVLDNNDEIDSQLQASDLLATNNFIPSSAGTHWHFQNDATPSDTQPIVPADDQAKALRELNAVQAQLNAVLREQQRLQRELFSAWWTYMAAKNAPVTNILLLRQNISILVGLLKSQIRMNADDKNGGAGLIQNLTNNITTKKAALGQVQAGSELPFYTQRDPTLLIAGLSSKWPTDWDENLNVRLNPQKQYNSQALHGMPSPFDPSIFQGKVPSSLATSMSNIMSEAEYGQLGAQAYMSTSQYWQNGDRQANNGWFPLFIEWEAEYYHIPFEQWVFAPRGPEAQIGYGLALDANPADPSIQGDYRVLNGRCPVLPQAGATLEATLKQVFSKINPDENKLSSEEMETLLADARSLDFSSTPLSGMTDQLLTRMQGMHVLPLMRKADGTIGVIPDAQTIGTDIDLVDTSDFLLMGDQTTKTPFASLVDIPADPTKYTPFKPCIHGQFRFTKLNIIDKFGQIVQGIQTFSTSGYGPQRIGPTATPLFPCLGDSYSVETNSDGTAKIVLPRTDKQCNFVQLPPSISQDARVNAVFLKEDTPPTWRELDEWENPVRGWLIINQANLSFQIFTPDGQFVREYGVASQKPITRPFTADQSLAATLDPVLKSFLARFADLGYTAGLFRAITDTTEAIRTNPSAYAESMLSVLGRPLALTVFGLNMQLADPPLQNQSTIATLPAQKLLTDYEFGVKVGDKDNVFDGLFGYFTAAPDVSKGVQVNWNDFHTYHTPSSSDPLILNDPARDMPTDTTLRPFYANPHAGTADAYAAQSLQNMQTFVGLVDPFTPVNIYTALLPIRQLSLPPWAISQGINEISTFFKMGPILVANDVPPFDISKVVVEDYRLNDASAPQTNGSVTVPAVGIGDWAWLQPYVDQSYSGGAVTAFNMMDVANPGEKPAFEDAPYTAVEGFLQQKKPFAKPDVLPT